MSIPIFEFIMNQEDTELGMSAISLVNRPAMESEFLAFNKTNIKQKFISFGEAKRQVAGLALIPDKLVYRVDEEGYEYMGYFSAATIEAIRNKFMKDKNIDNVNLQHDSENKVDAYLVESYILNTEARVNEVKAMGIDDACLGAWFVCYKFGESKEAEQAYQDALSGKYTGFSIEVMLQRELKLNNHKIKNSIMTKVNKLINKFKAILEEFEIGVFEDVKVADGTAVLRIGDVGTPVLKVIIAEDGTETTEAVVEGEYILEGDKTLVVDAQGNLVEIKEGVNPESVLPEGMSAEEVEAACKKKKFVESGSTDPSTSGSTENAPSGSTETVETPEGVAPAADVSAKTLGEIVDMSKDGETYIYVSVMGGKIVEAYVEVEQSLVKAEDFNAKQTRIQELEAEIVELKAKLEKPVSKSVFEISTVVENKTTKADLAKMNNLELTIHRLGLK